MAPTISTRLLASTLAVVLAGCTATVPGVARMGVDASNSDDVTVSLLDTGAYPVTAGHPYGAAGTQAGNLIESQRMGDFVSGPWQIDSTLRALLAVPTLPVDPSLLHDSGTLVDPVPDIAAAHGYIAGFSSDRKSPGPSPQRSLQNMVMRFGDPQSAVAAVQEIAAKANTDPAGRPVGIDGHSEASAWAYTQSDGAVEVRSYAAHGVYILNQSASADHDFDNGFQARLMIGGALTQQERTIDQFIPTDPGKLADLPMDPSGWLLARVLWAPDGKAPRSVGVYGPRAALHFEQDPVESDALFAAAGRGETPVQPGIAPDRGPIGDQGGAAAVSQDRPAQRQLARDAGATELHGAPPGRAGRAEQGAIPGGSVHRHAARQRDDLRAVEAGRLADDAVDAGDVVTDGMVAVGGGIVRRRAGRLLEVVHGSVVRVEHRTGLLAALCLRIAVVHPDLLLGVRGHLRHHRHRAQPARHRLVVREPDGLPGERGGGRQHRHPLVERVR